MEGSKFLKVMGILLIVFGSIALVVALIAVLGLGALATLAASAGVAIPMGMVTVSVILSLLGAVAELVAGILGVKNWAKPEKAGACIAWGVIILALCVISQVLTLIAYPANFSVLSVLTGLVLPVLYLIASVQCKGLRR